MRNRWKLENPSHCSELSYIPASYPRTWKYSNAVLPVALTAWSLIWGQRKIFGPKIRKLEMIGWGQLYNEALRNCAVFVTSLLWLNQGAVDRLQQAVHEMTSHSELPFKTQLKIPLRRTRHNCKDRIKGMLLKGVMGIALVYEERELAR